MEKSRVFIDSSVIVSALLSAKGGSFHILDSLHFNFAFYINQYVLDEVQRVFREKFTEQQDMSRRLFLLLGAAGVEVCSDPSKKDAGTVEKYISREDAPVLAGALAGGSSFLITLDKEFYEKKILAFAKSKSLYILSPKEFIQLFRNV